MRQTYVKRQAFDANLEIINMEDCLYNWRTNKQKPHSLDYLSMIQCPIKYNPNAKPKHFMKFLKEILRPEDIRTALEIIGYTFIRLHLFECYFILVGTGSNGKSVFIGVLCALHGKENTANVSLKELVVDRFALADLVGKNVNVDTELSSSTINDMSILKKLTGNQPIRVQKKGQHAFEATLWAKQIFNANQLPVTSDHTDAHYRREIILSFPHQFKEENDDEDDDDNNNNDNKEDKSSNIKIADIHMLKKLTTKKELSGIFNLVAKSMRAIDRNKKIQINSKSFDDRRAKAELTRDPIGAFVDICRIEPTSKSFVDKDTLYKYFQDLCGVRKIHVPSYGEFSEILTGEHGFKKKHDTWKERNDLVC
jgi:putative DNA primase/helicase